MRTRIRATLTGNLKRGEGQREFTKTVDAEFDRAGRSRLKSHQIANIYETNTATAFAAGQMARMIEVQEDFPFWKFSAIMDSHTSPEHAVLHDKIFRNGDFTFYPPLRHRCRCTAILLTARQAGKYPQSDMPGADQRAELYAKTGNPEFAGNKQGNYIKWLENEYKDADPATRRLIDQATEAMRQELKSMGKSTPKPTVQNTPEKAVSSLIPDVLAEGGAYVKGTNIRLDNKFFKLIDPQNPIKLTIDRKSGSSHYTPATKTVTIAYGKRITDSAWYKGAVIYHEFGHGIDWQRKLRQTTKVQTMLTTWRKKLPNIGATSDKLFKMYFRIETMGDKTFTCRGISKKDVQEQIMATLDTIKALNPNYGSGHSDKYFKQRGKREGEFLAHCFENKFAGNQVFKKYLPNLYQAMTEYIDELQ